MIRYKAVSVARAFVICPESVPAVIINILKIPRNWIKLRISRRLVMIFLANCANNWFII